MVIKNIYNNKKIIIEEEEEEEEEEVVSLMEAKRLPCNINPLYCILKGFENF